MVDKVNTIQYSKNSVTRSAPGGSFGSGSRDTLPLDQELGSSFDWEVLIGNYDAGTVFQYEEGLKQNFQQALDTDGKFQSIENLLIYPIVCAPWEIVGTKGDAGEADKIREILTSAPYEEGMMIPMDIIILQMAGAMTFKKAFFEKVFMLRERDGLIGYKKLAWRPPETCEVALDAKTGEYRGFRQRKISYEWKNVVSSDFGYVNMPIDRAFVYVYGSWKDPIEGISAMQVPYWCFTTKRKLMYLWYQYLETTSLPKTIASNQDEAKAIRDARRIATLKSRGVLGIGSDTSVSTLESSGQGAGQFIEAIRYLDSMMSQSVLAGFMDLSSMATEGKGSFALSEDQSKLFLRTRRVVAWDMARQFNEQVIAPLVRWNFGSGAPCPKMVFGPMSEANESVVLDAFNNLVTAATSSTSSGGIAIPDEFFDELVGRVSSILELDHEKVMAAIKTEGSPLKRLRHATEVALGAMQANESAQRGQPGITPEQVISEAAKANA